MLRSFAPAVFFVIALTSGCKKEAPPAPPAAPAPEPVASAAPSAAPLAPAGNMAHCPSTVAGAATAIDDSSGGVTLTVTAKDPSATSEIRARAQFLAKSAANGAAPITHNGTGEGGGMFGRCPVVMRSTTLVVTDVDGGSKIAVTPRNPKEQDWLRRESRERLADLEKPGAEGAGVGKMAHCPATVRGATMQISDTKDSILITFAAKDDTAVKDIKDRSQKIAAAAKTDPKTVKHDGTGNGGGGFGRCPVVLKDTTVEEKDTPSGATFAMKPKNAKDLLALKKEVTDRVAKFE